MKYSYTLIALAGAVLAYNNETPEQCAQRCAAQFNTCSTAQNPSPNLAFCAAQYKECTGDQDASSSNQPTACQAGAAAPTSPAQVEEPAPAADETPEECADRCLKEFEDCSTAQDPSPNFALCASNYKECTGNQDASSSNEPSACTGTGTSPTAAPTGTGASSAAPTGADATTPAAPAPTSSETPEQCADRCLKEFEDCSTAQDPSPNFALCASNYKECTGNQDASSSNEPSACTASGASPTAAPTGADATDPATPAPTSSETPEQCADRCLKQFEACSTVLDPPPNFSFCASQYKECTGNQDASSSNEPSACTASGASPTAAPTGTDATGTDATTPAAPAPTSSETPEECADRCLKQFEACSTAQDPPPNFSFCASQYKDCTGNPDASSSNTPATCSSSAAAAPEPASPSVGSGAGGASDATTMATAIAAPTGSVFVPGSNNSTIPTVSGAGAAKPAMALLALGALALL